MTRTPTSPASPPVTICVPVYNGARYLDACLDSVTKQTFADVDVLIVDDRSSDDSVAIAQRHAARDARLRIVRNERNLGLVGNWNRCVELARGQWIKFVFQDDLVAPACVETMLAAAGEASLVFCRRDFVFEEGTPPDKRDAYLAGKAFAEQLFPMSTTLSAHRVAELALAHMDRNIFGEPTAVLLHRRVFDACGGFNPNLMVSCDTEYWIRAGIRVGAVHVAEALASFRVHGESVSAKSLADRDYRVNVLDGLAMLHDALFLSSYAPLRAVAREVSIDLKERFVDRALWAYGIAARAARDPAHPDPTLLEQWDEVAEHFHGLKSIPLRYRAGRQWRALLGRCRALAGTNEARN